ncbi:signal transduction histidine kinase [Stackebrandtia albiflava]|uniref:histidine kinase n=1 Tax=Stackebrandtia albiflava TaxID=406432 RepID=A0A562V9K1_9ACTN|nr:sensor histidine kinase [Stackebrandtia albiflava]TWJ14556.1 signal transduction histidine kinase [Stackebrandtia albiflava]
MTATDTLRSARHGLRRLGTELFTARADPLPWGSLRSFGWVVHLLTLAFAWYALNENVPELVDVYRLGVTAGTTLAILQSVAVVLALRWPVPAWWLATATTAVTALAGEAYVEVSAAYPWTAYGMVLQAIGLFLLALRLRPVASITAYLVTSGVGATCAVLLATRPHRTTFDLAVIVLAVATVLGIAFRTSRVARAELTRQQILTATERARRELADERARIARELHDVVAHHMSVISIQAQVAVHLVPDPPQQLRDNLAGIRANAVDALTELRRVLGVLRSERPDDDRHRPQPTLDRIPELVDNVRGTGAAITLEIRGEPRVLSPGVELSAYRIAQEALSNALRHAPGTRITLLLDYRPDTVAVEVDNTAPAEPAAPNPGGLGLAGMRERAAMLGGEVTTLTRPDGGYRVTAVLPATGGAA